jgi:peptidoglycan/xylan/chitin deacetylase (PgdA/CDA1 family)
LILDILSRNKSKATFYLNAYEIAKYGEKDIKEIAQEILLKGQDLQLHTHPDSMYGKYQISLFDVDKQEEILRKGKELIFLWTGNNVVAHRAGGYSGNSDTIEALKRTGFSADSSLSPAAFSPLSKEGFSDNDVRWMNGILELPVTYFTQFKLFNWESKRILDIESSSLSEIIDVLNQMADKNSCTINIMMHSFSITRYGYPDQRVIEKLDDLLKFIDRNPKLQAISTKEFVELYSNNNISCISTPDFIPHTGIISAYLRSWERFSDGWKNVVFALSIPILSLLTFMSVLLIRSKLIKILFRR